MGKLSTPHGTAYIHVGTHKTGTSIQAFLAMNDESFRKAGIFVPRTARTNPDSAGHHNIAWELARDAQFDPVHGTFDALLREVAAANVPTVCLSSEDFEFLNFDEGALRRLRDGLLTIGYEPKIVLYLRPQTDYLESLYAEVSRAWNIEFQDFFDTIVATGVYGRSRFDYEQLTGAFAGVFGEKNTIVRAYRASAPAVALLTDFVGVIAPRLLGFDEMTIPARLNPMAAFPNVIASRERQLGCAAHHSIAPRQRFDPLSLLDIARLIARFSRSNDRVARRYATHIGCVTTATFARELITELFRDRESRYRKRLIRALVEYEAEIAA